VIENDVVNSFPILSEIGAIGQPVVNEDGEFPRLERMKKLACLRPPANFSA
jgi:hypothetical protein